MASVSPTELQKIFLNYFWLYFLLFGERYREHEVGWYGGEEDLVEFEGMRNIIKMYFLIEAFFK